MGRVLASAKTRKRIEAMINSEVSEVDKSMLIREAAPLIVEEALEGEVADALGRDSSRPLAMLETVQTRQET